MLYAFFQRFSKIAAQKITFPPIVLWTDGRPDKDNFNLPLKKKNLKLAVTNKKKELYKIRQLKYFLKSYRSCIVRYLLHSRAAYVRPNYLENLLIKKNNIGYRFFFYFSFILVFSCALVVAALIDFFLPVCYKQQSCYITVYVSLYVLLSVR